MANEISKTPTQAKLQVIPLSKIHEFRRCPLPREGRQ